MTEGKFKQIYPRKDNSSIENSTTFFNIFTQV